MAVVLSRGFLVSTTQRLSSLPRVGGGAVESMLMHLRASCVLAATRPAMSLISLTTFGVSTFRTSKIVGFTSILVRPRLMGVVFTRRVGGRR